MSETNAEFDRFRSPLPFGWQAEDGLTMMEFCPDPNSSGYRWYRPTDEIRSTEGLILAAEASRSYTGRCVDAGEWYSPEADMLYSLLQSAPEQTTIAGFEKEGWAGTRTFGVTIKAFFYTD